MNKIEERSNTALFPKKKSCLAWQKYLKHFIIQNFTQAALYFSHGTTWLVTSVVWLYDKNLIKYNYFVIDVTVFIPQWVSRFHNYCT